MFPDSDDSVLPERLWDYSDFAAAQDPPVRLATGLANLGFLRAAIRRGAMFCCVLGFTGFVAGLGYYLKLPPSYQATTTLYIPATQGLAPGQSVLYDQSQAASTQVATRALAALGLRESPATFLASYTTVGITDEILEIVVNAPSPSAAVSRAAAIARAALSYHNDLLATVEQQTLASLNRQINQQNVNALASQIARLAALPTTPVRRATLGHLRQQLTQERGELTLWDNGSQQETIRQTTAQEMRGFVLDSPTAVHSSRLKHLVSYAAIGLIAGGALALGTVVLRALISDRMRQRHDVAEALGAPVKLSVGVVKLRRWLPGRHGLAAARIPAVQRIIAYLGSTIPDGPGTAALAVIPVDGMPLPSVCLVSAALARAREGSRVVLADLCDGAPAARLLRVTKPGVHVASVRGTQLTVVVPEPGGLAPVGPLGPHGSGCPEPVAAAYEAADVLLTLAPLDPSLGWEHLPTWAPGAVAMVTAGRASVARVVAVGEMARLAGVPLIAAVLTGADRGDESLGVPPAPPEALTASNGEDEWTSRRSSGSGRITRAATPR